MLQIGIVIPILSFIKCSDISGYYYQSPAQYTNFILQLHCYCSHVTATALLLHQILLWLLQLHCNCNVITATALHCRPCYCILHCSILHCGMKWTNFHWLRQYNIVNFTSSQMINIDRDFILIICFDIIIESSNN